MVGLQIHLRADDAEVKRVLAGLVRRGQDLTPAMDEIGSMLVASTIDRFERETGPDGRRWTPSQRVLKHGGQTLTDTGRLRSSITHRAGRNFVAVGTNVIYAAIHQLGGKAGRGHAADIPARPYLGIDADDETEILEILRDHLVGGLA